METDRLTPYRAVHPGEVLAAELDERGLEVPAFAERIGLQPSHLESLLAGRRQMTVPIAVALEEALGISYESWMRLQYGYEYDKMMLSRRRAANRGTRLPRVAVL